MIINKYKHDERRGASPPFVMLVFYVCMAFFLYVI